MTPDLPAKQSNILFRITRTLSHTHKQDHSIIHMSTQVLAVGRTTQAASRGKEEERVLPQWAIAQKAQQQQGVKPPWKP